MEGDLGQGGGELDTRDRGVGTHAFKAALPKATYIPTPWLDGGVLDNPKIIQDSGGGGRVEGDGDDRVGLGGVDTDAGDV